MHRKPLSIQPNNTCSKHGHDVTTATCKWMGGSISENEILTS